MIRMLPLYLLLCLLSAASADAQSADTVAPGALSLPSKVFTHIGARAASQDDRITRQTAGYLSRMARKESDLQTAVGQKDSLAAKKIFTGARQKYRALMASLKAAPGSGGLPALKEYLPAQDSMETALHFLGQSGAATPGFPSTKLDAIRNAQSQLQQLQGRWQQARDIESFVRLREQQLQEQLTGYGLGKKLLGVNREAFYFQQQLVEYKAMLQDRDKLQAKVLSSLRNSTAFQHFMQKNSYVGRLFSLPDNYGSTASLPGLQTKEMMQQRIGLGAGSAQPGAGGSDPGQYLQQKVDNGQQQISQLKSKLRSLGNFSGGGDVVMPQFTPNSQKVKSLFKRIVYSVNVQTQQSSTFMPATADLALMLGYKLTDKTIVGVGGSYNIGLGQGITHLSYSGQGAGIRSYIDVKARGSLWLTGALEYNYVQGFSAWSDLSHWDQWQKSALFGLTKKFKLSANKSSSMQLLFDALYKQHVPPSSPLLFRVGYSFN
jgi:hypothetical protein